MASGSRYPDSGSFPRGAIATPNHHATEAGREVLAAGGNAVDAVVVAAGLVLAVVTPYHADRGRSLAETLAEPRFVVDVADGSVALEPGVPVDVAEGLADAGHAVTTLTRIDLAGHAHLIAPTSQGYDVASDPRCDGGASGI